MCIRDRYDFTAIEKKWQTKWKDEKTFACQTGEQDKPKFYGLVEFPYPSGNGLHVGHARPYTAMDLSLIHISPSHLRLSRETRP